MGPDIPERGWKNIRPPKVRWGSKKVLRQGDPNLSKLSSPQFSSSFNTTMTGLLHYLHFIWLDLNKTKLLHHK